MSATVWHLQWLHVTFQTGSYRHVTMTNSLCPWVPNLQAARVIPAKPTQCLGQPPVPLVPGWGK